MTQYNDKILGVFQGAGFMAVECLIGIYKAFEEANIVPGKILSSSGGTLFSSLYYSKGDVVFLEELANSSTPSDFIELKPIETVKTLLNKSNYMFDNTAVFNLLQKHMTGEAAKRVTTSVTCNTDWTSHMKAVTPGWAMAATSIPFVFPPVKIGEHCWSDGGVLNNLPTPSFEEAKEYDHIFVFAAPPTKLTGSESLLPELLNLFQAIMEREFHQTEESGFFELPNVSLIQPKDAFNGSVLSWSDNFALKDSCYTLTKEILQNVNI